MGLDEETYLGLPAFGPQSNQLPLDRKITLFFKYTKGIEWKYVLKVILGS